MAKYSIIVSGPAFSSRLRDCLEGIANFTSPDIGGLELIVVQSAIEDTHQIREFLNYEDTHLFGPNWDIQILSAAPSKSRGVARNIGAAEATGDFFVFLDWDILVTRGWLEALCVPATETRVGVVGAKVIDMENHSVSHAGLVFNSTLKGFYPIYQHFDQRFHGVNKQREFQAVLGSCILVRSGVFDSVGGFASYECEDIDFCLKAREAGASVVYTPACLIQHRGPLSRSHICSAQDSFRKRWSLDQMQSDDARYYYEDGMRVRIDEKAVISYKEVVSESCEYVAQALRLGLVGKREEAEELLLKALVVYPGNADAYLELTEICIHEGLVEKALSYCEKLLSLQPPVLKAKLIKAQILIKQNQQSIAAELLKDLWESPDVDDSLKNEARKLLRTMVNEAN